MNRTCVISRPTSVDIMVPVTSNLLPRWLSVAIATPEMTSIRTTWRRINDDWCFTFEATTNDLADLLQFESTVAAKGFPIQWESPLAN